MCKDDITAPEGWVEDFQAVVSLGWGRREGEIGDDLSAAVAARDEDSAVGCQGGGGVVQAGDLGPGGREAVE